MHFSLWLMPPKKDRIRIRNQIEYFATREGASNSIFEPHVTIIGGVPCCSSRKDGEKVMQTLRKGLSGFGEVECRFSKRPSFMTSKNKDTNCSVEDSIIPVWNQGALFLVESEDFTRIWRKSRALLGMEDNGDLAKGFPPPIRQPHLTIYYGQQKIPAEEEIQSIETFKADRVALWMTEPPTLEGVSQWEEIGFIDLLPKTANCVEAESQSIHPTAL